MQTAPATSLGNNNRDRSTYRICPLCEVCCGLTVRSSGDRVVSIRGTQHDPFSQGYICPKAAALKDLHEDPDRLRTPLIRRNGQLWPVTCDEAFAEIERRLLPLQAAHGRDSVALVLGNPAAHEMGLLLYFGRLAKALDRKNLFSASTLDQMPKPFARSAPSAPSARSAPSATSAPLAPPAPPAPLPA